MSRWIASLVMIVSVLAGSPLEASLHPRAGEATPGLRLYRQGTPVVLSDVAKVVDDVENTKLAAWANASSHEPVVDARLYSVARFSKKLVCSTAFSMSSSQGNGLRST